MCSWTATIFSSSAGTGPRTVFTLDTTLTFRKDEA
jgi:hypothetical protein